MGWSRGKISFRQCSFCFHSPLQVFWLSCCRGRRRSQGFVKDFCYFPPPLETQARCRRRARTPAHPCRTASQPVSRLPAASRQARASLSKRCLRAERDPSPEGTRTWPSAGRRARRTPGRSALARPSTSGRALATLLLARRCAALSKPRPVWPASAADWPRLVGARGSLPEA